MGLANYQSVITKEETSIKAPPLEEPSGALSEIPKKKKKAWRYRTPPELTLSNETVFLNMQLRKTSRALAGAQTRNTNYEFVALAVMLVLIFSLGTKSREDDPMLNTDVFVTLSLGQVVAIGVWLFVAAAVTAIFAGSRFIQLLNWMFIYLPLVAIMLSFMFDTKQISEEGLLLENYDQWFGIFLLVTELLAVAIFVSIFYLYPNFINSTYFRSNRMAARFWKVKVITDWTMTYKRKTTLFKRRCACKYQGETNDDGLPHGIGRWFDDSPEGEVLTGHWRKGIPVAPFFSRQYGRGDVFSAVRIAYVMASDDVFESPKFWATNDNPARCGIGNVECSVSGAFYNGLPRAEQLIDETTFDETTSVEILCKELKHIGEEGGENNDILVKASDPRGVQIVGHVHSNTGKTFNKVDEILIKVRPMKDERSSHKRPKLEFMPRVVSKRGSVHEMVAVREDDDSDDKSNDESGDVSPAVVPMAPITEDKDQEEVESGKRISKIKTDVKLEVQTWIPAKHKDALIFLAGFNCGLKEALQGFGQFVAMTKLDSAIYPILFAWPPGTVASYLSASRASHNEQNKKNFLSLMKSLQHAGIRNVHMMSHSMGAQTLVGVFCDNEDGSRSDVSNCFRLAPDFEEEEKGKGVRGSHLDDDGNNLLVCKTLTMLNPDFPLKSFVSHSFRSIRRICRAVTVVGDSTDTALFYSQLMNGIAVYFGYKQPRELLPDDRNKKHLRVQPVVGRCIESLYLPEEQQAEQSTTTVREGLLFKERAPLTLVEEDDDVERSWLDLDVIDTSGLDTNIANIRHSAFNLNPILLNDLEELVRTGNRAMKRSSLLYRDGNLYSYCHAPSYVAY